MQLYRKYNYEERHSYRLDYIGEMEVGEKKVVGEGSLDRLYNYDSKKPLEYNIQDVMLLDKLDKKLQFIDLANTIAHDNTVLFQQQWVLWQQQNKQLLMKHTPKRICSNRQR